MLVSNTILKLYNSVFSNNGVLLSHSQIARDNCSSVLVAVKSCVFNNDLNSRPLYEPGVMLAGCEKVKLEVSDSQFHTAPVVVNVEVDGDVRLHNVTLSGVALRGSSVDVRLGPGDNSVTLKDCNVTGHEASRSSPISISTDTSPYSSAVTIRNVRFHDNRRLKTRGAAMSIFARFTRQTAPPRLNVSITDCSFTNNSVDDLQVAGALYVANVASVQLTRCHFERNAASDGGAVHIYSSSDVHLNDCVFNANSAVNPSQTSYASRAGALYAESSQLQMVDCTFTNNSAEYSASAVFASDATGLSLIRCEFIEPSDAAHPLTGPGNAIVSLSSGATRSPDPLIALKECRIASAVSREHLLLSVVGPTSINNSSVTCQSDAMSLHHAALPAAFNTASYQLQQLSVWSQTACHADYYASLTDTTRCQLILDGKLADLNHSSQLCYACSAHAHCDAAVIHPDYNYYMYATTDGHAEVHLCPAGYCEPTNSTTRQGCTDGRTGLVCSGCDQDRVMALHFNNYLSCDSPANCMSYTSSSAAIICFTLFYMTMLLLLLRLSRRQRHHVTPSSLVSSSDDLASTSTRPPANTSHVTTSFSLIGCVFPLVYYFQLLPSVYPRLMTSSWWLDRVIQFFTSLFHLYPAALAAGRGFCLTELMEEPSPVAVQRYFFTMSIYWSQLILIILLFFLLSAMFLLGRGPFTEQNIKMLVTFFLPAFLFFQMFSYVPLLRLGLQSVHCVAFNSSSVLFSDAATSCYTSWQIFSVIYIIVCVAPLCLVIDTAAFVLSRGRVSVLGYLGVCLFPVFGLALVPFSNLRATRNRNSASDDDEEIRDEFEVDETCPEGLRSVSTHCIVMIQSVLIKPFGSYWSSSMVDVGWMTVILVRNFIICTLSTLLQHEPSIRSILITLFCLCFTADQIVYRGYVLRDANRLDMSSWLLLSVLSICDIYVSVKLEASQAVSTWSAVDWLARLVASLPFIIIFIIIIISITRAVYRRAVRRRRTRPQSETSLA